MANHDSPIPTTIGRYQVQALIGRGGMGEVYKAFDPRLDRVVALKTIRAGSDADGPVLLDRLFREARACGRLHHPGIVTVHDLGDVGDVVFIAMEYLEGEDLQSASERGRFGFEQKIRVVIQILDALQYAHGEGVIHRDIKPSNVHVMSDGTVKLLDFGLARVTRAESLTLSGAIMGTPFYMSPEQLKGQNIDARTDIYSTGALAYELLTSRRAFDAPTLTAVMLKVLSEPPPPMETAWTAAFPEIERIVLRSVAKNPEDRYETAKDMRDALEAFLAASEPAMASVAAAAEASTQSALSAARTLLVSGRVEESHVVLARTLRENPDAIEVRALLAEATRVSAPPPKALEATIPLAAPPVPSKAIQGPAPPAAPKPAGPQPLPVTTPQTMPEAVTVAAPAKSTRGRDLMILGGFAAVVAVAAAWWTFGSFGNGQTTQPPVTTASTTTPSPATPSAPAQVATAPPTEVSAVPPPSASTPQVQPQGPAAGTPTAASDPASSAPSTPAAGRTTPPGAPSSNPAPAPSSPPAAPPAATPNTAPDRGQSATPPPSRQTSAPRGGTARPTDAATPPAAPIAANATGVFIESGLDPALRAELLIALRDRDVPMAANAQSARYRVRGDLDMSVRTQNIGQTTTMTAEFAITVDMLDQRTNTPESQRLEGRALGFSDTGARTAGFKAAAEQMADAIRQVTRR